MPPKRGLGRGLNALIQDRDAPPAAAAHPAQPTPAEHVPIDRIRPSPYQPRRTFTAEAIEELAASIREKGVIQPLIVRRVGDHLELIAGERRLRASGVAGLTEVPVRVLDVGDSDALLIALVENLQREDLNPIEEAEGYRALGERFGMTQDTIATQVGKARASVANALRLLALPGDVRELVRTAALSAGHAKALAALEIAEEQTKLARQAVEQGWSVREVEREVERRKRAPRKPRVSRSDMPDAHLKYVLDLLHNRFMTSVRVTPCKTYANGKKARGTIEIDYFSTDDLDRILQVLGVAET